MPVEKSAGAVIFREEQANIYYLVLHYQAGHWDFVKGNIEKGEEKKQTIIRETEEETGIKGLKFIEGFKETIEYFYKLKGRTIFKTVVFFLTETKIKEIKLSQEHIGFTWLTYEDALGCLTFENAKEVLRKANDFLKNQE
jgi:8-oxo-dGTP pyrophosphatase MutT (NUDIX family)